MAVLKLHDFYWGHLEFFPGTKSVSEDDENELMATLAFSLLGKVS